MSWRIFVPVTLLWRLAVAWRARRRLERIREVVRAETAARRESGDWELP